MPAGGVRIKQKWFGKPFFSFTKKQVHLRMGWVGVLLERAVKRNLSNATRSLGPSPPGGFPHTDTGYLRQSIFFEVTKAGRSVIVGTPVIYGLYLEVGTKKMAARPFLVPTLNQNKAKIHQILTADKKSALVQGGFASL